MQGDELRLRYVGTSRSTWEGVGHVVRGPSSIHPLINSMSCDLSHGTIVRVTFNYDVG